MVYRSRMLGIAAAVALLLVGVFVTTAGAVAEPVTYSATVTVPAPPASDFPGASGGGDGWAVALSADRLYNVFHHDSATRLNCRKQADAAQCWSPKTITDDTGGNYRTSIAPGLFLAQDTGKLYVPVTRAADNTAGVLCIDTSQPDDATGAEMFCGFTALSGVGDSPPDYSQSGLSNPIQIGSRWYMVNEVSGTPTGTEDTMLCFDLSSFGPCEGQPFAIDLGGLTWGSASYSTPMGHSGTRLFPQITGSTRAITCFDTETNGACGEAWPVIVGSGQTPPPYPLLDGNGVPIGVCDETTGNPCWDFAGATVATPPGMSAAIPPSSYPYGGAALTLGPRVYQPNPESNQVHCYDYNEQAGCENFPKSFENLGLLYTVNADPYRPACIWVNADNGTAQIQNFDAFSGGPCGQGAIRVLSSSVVVPSEECIPASWTSLQVLSPARSTYTSAMVSFQDQSGNAIPGFAPRALDGTGTADLTDLQLSTENALPQFLIALEGAGDVGQVQVKLTWTGLPSETCEGEGITATDPPLTGSFSPGYRIGALDGGVFTFGGLGFEGSLGGTKLNGQIIDIVNTPSGNGYWLVGRDGGVFAFGDAVYYGSAPGLGLAIDNVVALLPTPDGGGYWLVQRNGGVLSFGNAAFHGSVPQLGLALDNFVDGIATASGGGYWLAQRNGGVFSFGDAAFHGSAPAQGIIVDNIVGMGGTLGRDGYWLAQRNGGVLSFGNAAFHGSVPAMGIVLDDVVNIGVTRSGNGYWLVKRDGGVMSFGDAPFYGSLATSPLNLPPVAIAT
ncbi:MAG TPA: hypothetical protein VFV35_05050 [Acidimicrobiales bacterium]|nr:hypothetical protein [Acidimicrobiales bacterium]